MSMTEIPLPGPVDVDRPPAPAPTATDQKLDALIGAVSTLAERLGAVGPPVNPAAPTAPAAGSPVRPALSAAMPRDPEPPPAPPAAPLPHPGEVFAPGEFGYYSYHRNGDPEGVMRTQLVAVAHVTADHVHGLVLGDVADVASFGQGVLTHGYPEAG